MKVAKQIFILLILFSSLVLPSFAIAELNCRNIFSAILPAAVSQYMSNKRLTLLNDYKTPDGKYVESCVLIAWKIAELLIDAGESPTLVAYSRSIVDGYSIESEMLKPVVFSGRVSWGTHVVVLNRGFVYDPIVGHPVPVDAYSQIVFGKEIPWSNGISTDYIRKVGADLRKQNGHID